MQWELKRVSPKTVGLLGRCRRLQRASNRLRCGQLGVTAPLVTHTYLADLRAPAAADHILLCMRRVRLGIAADIHGAAPGHSGAAADGSDAVPYQQGRHEMATLTLPPRTGTTSRPSPSAWHLSRTSTRRGPSWLRAPPVGPPATADGLRLRVGKRANRSGWNRFAAMTGSAAKCSTGDCAAASPKAQAKPPRVAAGATSGTARTLARRGPSRNRDKSPSVYPCKGSHRAPG